MPTTRRSRTIQAPAAELWALVSDPHHLPRWWPRVTRVEGVADDAFTEVLMSERGKIVRADFTLVEADERALRMLWCQQLEGSPFARVLARAETEVTLAAGPTVAPAPVATHAGAVAAAHATCVTIELRQALTGFLSRLGSYLVARAAAATLEDALDGLQRIGAVEPPAAER